MTGSDLGLEGPPRCQRAEEDTEALRGPRKEAAPCSRLETPQAAPCSRLETPQASPPKSSSSDPSMKSSCPRCSRRPPPPDPHACLEPPHWFLGF